MHETFNDRLYEPAIDAITIGIQHVLSQGWHVVIAHRHSGEPWDACPTDVCGSLAAVELLDLIDGSLVSMLRL